MNKPTPEGWGKPGGSRKWHWFRGRRSLCGAWMFWAVMGGTDTPPNSGDCAKCRKVLERERKPK